MLIARFVALALMLSSAVAFARDSSGLADELVTAPGAGQVEQELANKHFNDGVDLFRDKKFALALKEFQLSYDLTHSPDLLHNLSICNEKIGQIQAALSLEEQFLTERRKDLTAREIDETEGRLLRLRREAGQTVSGNAPPPRKYKPPIGAMVLVGIGGASLMGGIAAGILSLQTAQTIENGGQFYYSDLQDSLSRHSTLRATAISLDVIGGVALASGAIWAIVDRMKRR